MKRLQLFEFTDLPWFPLLLKQGITDFLATIISKTRVYESTLSHLQETLEECGEKEILVLGAGSGGGILDLLRALPAELKVSLSDLYPPKGFVAPSPSIRYIQEPIDATQVPASIQGVRVLYTVFHHLDPESARKVLADAVQAKRPILIFEASERSVKGLIVNVFVPLFVLAVTPSIKPFRLWRLFFTYLVPLLPLIIAWDGFISSLRTYSLDEMREMVRDLDDFHWDIGHLKGAHGERIAYLKGIPKGASRRCNSGL